MPAYSQSTIQTRLILAADEVGGQQVVVAGHRLVLGPGQGLLDSRGRAPAPPRTRPGSRRRARALSARRSRPAGTNRSRCRETGTRRRRGSARSADAICSSIGGSRSSSGLIPTADDELGDDRRRVVERGRHRRRDAEARGPAVGRDLAAAVDLQQRGVLAGDADHVVGGAHPRPVIAVGDATLERVGPFDELSQFGGHRIHDFSQIVSRGLDSRPSFRLGLRRS